MPVDRHHEFMKLLQDHESVIRNRHAWADQGLDELRDHLSSGVFAKDDLIELQEIIGGIESDFEVAVKTCVRYRGVLDDMEKTWPKPSEDSDERP